MYPAMEDFSIDFVMDKGLNARSDADPAPALHARRGDDPARHAPARRSASASGSSIISTSTEVEGSLLDHHALGVDPRRRRSTPAGGRRHRAALAGHPAYRQPAPAARARLLPSQGQRCGHRPPPPPGDALDREGVDGAGLDRLDRPLPDRHHRAVPRRAGRSRGDRRHHQRRGGNARRGGRALPAQDRLRRAEPERPQERRLPRTRTWAMVRPPASRARANSRWDERAGGSDERDSADDRAGQIVFGIGSPVGYPGGAFWCWQAISLGRCHGSDDCRATSTSSGGDGSFYFPLGNLHPHLRSSSRFCSALFTRR